MFHAIVKRHNLQQGQMLLIIILVMVVALTIGLSIVARTITNVRTSNEEENSQRAFSAAEAGIERSLASCQAGSSLNCQGTSTPVTFNTTSKASYTTQINNPSGIEFLINNGSPILKDDSADIWLSHYPDYDNQWPTSGTGHLTVFWGSPSTDQCSDNTLAAIELILIGGSITNPSITHYAFDPCTTTTGAARAETDHFSSAVNAGGTVAGKNFSNNVTITIPSSAPGPGIIIRVVPVFAQTVIGVRGDSPLPSQGNVITSTGTSGDTTRKIVTFQSYPKVPIELFPYVIFSPQ